MNYILEISASMQDVVIEDILRYKFLMENFDEVNIKKIIDGLKCDNLRIILSSQAFETTNECDSVEPIYGTKYSMKPFTADIFERWKEPKLENYTKKLDLPIKNKFLPDNMEIFAKDFDSLPLFP